MQTVATCSGCRKRFRIPKEKAGRKLKCPKCGAAIQTGSPSDSDLSPTRTAPRKAAKRRSHQVDVSAFTKKAVLIVSGLTGIGLLIALGGLMSETVAMVATGFLIVLMVGCALGGHVWQAVDHGRRSVGLGLAALLLPLVGPVLAIRDRSPAIRGTILIGLALIPTLVGLGTTTVFRKMYDGSVRSAARAETAIERLEALDERIDLDSPPKTARYRVNGSPTAVADLRANAESFLTKFDSYVAGSMRYDESARELTLQYRGTPAVPIGYAMGLRDVSKAFLVYQRDEPEPGEAPE